MKIEIKTIEELKNLKNKKHIKHLIFDNRFNQPLLNSLDNLTSLQQLTFGEDFNQPLLNSLDNLSSLQQLTFGEDFNQPLLLDNLTNLQQLTLGWLFEQPLLLPNTITYLNMECDNYEHELNLPFGIKHLILSCNNSVVDYLPNGIETLELNMYFDMKLDDLPSGMKTIIFGYECDYDKELNNLPRSLEKLVLPKNYPHEIKNKPENLIIEYH